MENVHVIDEYEILNEDQNSTGKSAPLTQIEPIYTSIAEVNLATTLTETDSFQRVLREIPLKVAEADNLLIEYRTNPDDFLETMDESELDKQLKELQTVSKFVRDVEKAKKEIKSYMNNVRDGLVNEIDERLIDAKYDKLEKAQSDIKQLKKDVDADRRANRWLEIKTTFEANINRYPLIDKFAPELTDFSKFKLLNPKLVSGAKTRKVKESDHVHVNETIYAWNTAIELMKNNEWGLSAADLMSLLDAFKREPSVELVNREGRQLKLNADMKEKARIENERRMAEEEEKRKIAEAKRAKELIILQEKERLAKAARDREAEESAKKQQLELQEKARIAEAQEKKRIEELNQFGGQYRVIFKESFPKFIAYMFENKNYHDVHNNPQTKAAIIYDIMQQMVDPNSVVVNETNKDPQKVLDLVRYILDA